MRLSKLPKNLLNEMSWVQKILTVFGVFEIIPSKTELKDIVRYTFKVRRFNPIFILYLVIIEVIFAPLNGLFKSYIALRYKESTERSINIKVIHG